MDNVILQLGGNLGDVEETFRNVIDVISEKVGEVVLIGSIFQSPPWGFETEALFKNQIVEIKTAMLPHNLLQATQMLEIEFGRTQKSANGYQSRIIDIDILFYGQEVIETPTLIIPHAFIPERRFVLEPLMEHWSGFIHPRFLVSVNKLFEECADKSELTKL